MEIPAHSTYYMNEVSFELGDALEDSTIHRFEARGEHGPIAIVVCRASAPPDKSLQELVVDRLRRDATRVLGYTVLAWDDSTLAGVPAVIVASRYGGAVPCFQRDIHFLRDRTWFLIGGTGSAADAATIDACLAHVGKTMKFRT